MSTNPKALHAASESTPDMAHDARMRLAASAREPADPARQRSVGSDESDAVDQDSRPDTLQDAALAKLGAQINVIAARLQDGTEAQATAGSKRQAEQAAAEALLAKLEKDT